MVNRSCYTYDSLNRLQSVVDNNLPSGRVAHTSPAVGLVWGSDSGGRTFVFDSENHLTSMNGGAVTIVYDGDGNRAGGPELVSF